MVRDRHTVVLLDNLNRMNYRYDLWNVVVLHNLDRITDNRANRWTEMVHFKTNSLSSDTITYCIRTKVDWMYVHF